MRDSYILSIVFSLVLLTSWTSVSASHVRSLPLTSCLLRAHRAGRPGEEMCGTV